MNYSHFRTAVLDAALLSDNVTTEEYDFLKQLLQPTASISWHSESYGLATIKEGNITRQAPVYWVAGKLEFDATFTPEEVALLNSLWEREKV